MPEPNAGTGTTETTPAGGSATATGTTGAGSAGGSAAETPEQKVARLEAEKQDLERKNTQLLSEKSTVEKKARENEEKERRLATTPPAASTGVDPRVSMLEELDAMDRELPNNPVIKASQEALRGTMRAELYNQALLKLDADLQKYPATHREQMRALMLSGETRTLEAAHGVVNDRITREAGLAEENARLKKEKEELERDLKARSEGRVGIGGRPSFEPANNSPTMKRSEYQQKVTSLENAAIAGDKTKRKEALQLIDDVQTRKIRLIDG